MATKLGKTAYQLSTEAGGLIARLAVRSLRMLLRSVTQSGQRLLELGTWFVARPVAIGVTAVTLLSGGVGGIAVATDLGGAKAAAAESDAAETAALAGALRLNRLPQIAPADGTAIAGPTGAPTSLPADVAEPATEPVVAAEAAPAARAESAVRAVAAPRIAASNGASPLVTWPHPGAITGAFGEHRGSHRHAGLDIDGDTGDAVRAAGPGVVVGAGQLGSGYSGYGIVVLIDHGDGIRTLSAHLSRVTVAVGQEVAAGEVVGAVGNTGSSRGSHLHFEVRRGEQPMSPMEWLPRR